MSAIPLAALNQRLAAGRGGTAVRLEVGLFACVAGRLGNSKVVAVCSSSRRPVPNSGVINPGNPRAIYFNDETYVGWVPGAPVLEISPRLQAETRPSIRCTRSR